MLRSSLFLMLLILGACSSESGPFTNRQAIETNTAAEVADAVAPVERATIDPVPADQVGQLAGELRCSFADTDQRVLLIGSANVGRNEPVDAIIGGDGRAILLQREVAGGFAALRRGGSFAGGGIRATVTVGEAEPTGHEGSAHLATLTLVPTGEATRVADGRWSCGP